jgi:hypothetical protein
MTNDDIANGRAAVRQRLKALSETKPREAHRIFTEHCAGADKVGALSVKSCRAILNALDAQEPEVSYKLGYDPNTGEPTATPVKIPKEHTAQWLNTHPDSALGSAVEMPVKADNAPKCHTLADWEAEAARLNAEANNRVGLSDPGSPRDIASREPEIAGNPFTGLRNRADDILAKRYRR